MIIRAMRTALLAGWLAAGGAAISEPESARPITLEDILAFEGFGSALIDPSGSRLVFEKLRPYDQNTDYSFRSYAYARSGHQIWVHDLRTDGDPVLLPGLDPAPHSYLLGFSPSGRYLAFLQYSLGRLSLGSYDFETDEAVLFGPAPAIGRGGEFVPVWSSEDHLLYTALPDGEWPAETSLRAGIGRLVTQGWVDAWTGARPTAREVRTRPAAAGPSGRLLRASVTTGEVRDVTAGRLSDLRLSPDRTKVAGFLAQGAEMPADRIVDSHDRLAHYLVTVDLDTSALRRLSPLIDYSPSSLVWHRNGNSLAAFGWQAGDASEAGRFYRIDTRTREAVAYDHTGLDLVSERERGWLHRPERAAFLGDRLAVFARPVPEAAGKVGRFSRAGEGSDQPAPGWYALSVGAPPIPITGRAPGMSPVPLHSGTEHVTFVSDEGAYRYYADGRRARLTPPLEGRFRVQAHGTLAARAGLARPDFENHAVFDVVGGPVRMTVVADLREGHEGRHTLFSAPPGGETLAGALSREIVASLAPDGAVSHLRLAGTEGRVRDIAAINLHMAGAGAGDWRSVEYTVPLPGGAVHLQSCVLLPAGFAGERPPPLVIDIYPGSGADCPGPDAPPVRYPDPGSPHIWASHGFAYARLSLPVGMLGDEAGPLSHLPTLVETGAEALASEGYGDAHRMVLHGFSMGGVSALYTAAHAPRFRAVIAKHSWTDLFSHYFGSPGTLSLAHDGYFGAFSRYETDGLFGMGATPFEAPGIYVRNSPVFLSRQIDMPVLLIGSDLDTFDLSQFDEMYGGLLRAEKEAVYVRYLGEGHGVSSPANIRDMWQRKLDFLKAAGLEP